MRNFVIVPVLTLFIFSCAPSPKSAQVPTIPSAKLATITFVPTRDGLSAYATKRIATVIAIKTASATSLPTRTVTQTPAIDLTSLNATFPDSTSVAEATQNASYDKYCDGIYGYFFNENWAICDRDPHNFTLFSLDGHAWQYSYEELGVANGGEGPEYITRAVYWTKDGLYAYVTPFPEGYDPLGPFLGNGIALFRVDLKNGEIKSILPPYYFYSISISPTGKYLAYVIFDKPSQLVIQDLQSGETWQIELEPKYTQAGALVWSDDESKVAYKLIIDGDECAREFAIRLLNIGDMKSTTVINDTKVDTCQPADPTYYVVDVTDDSVFLEQGGNVWVYKISTKRLSLQATATPKP